MAAVTQKTPNYLGGISQQSEELMLPGQLLDANNVYADPALGLVKRPGLQYVGDIVDTSLNQVYPATHLIQARWFPIFLGPGVNFFGCVGTDTIRVFGTDGVERFIAKPFGTNYLSTINDLYDVSVLTVNEYTFIVNKKRTVSSQPTPSPPWQGYRNATIVISEVHYGAQYSIKLWTTPANLGGVPTTITYTTFNAEAAITTPAQTERTVTANQILLGLNALLPSGFYGIIVGNTLDIYYRPNILQPNQYFECSTVGALSNVGISSFQDDISDVSKLPSKSVTGRTVRVVNSSAKEDDYWLVFTAINGDGFGDGYWTETIDPRVSPGFDSSSAPHILTYDVNTDSFTFTRGSYVNRLVGDNLTNPDPSFVDAKIQAAFFYNNRLGFLTEESIVMSQTNDFFNFYSNSALTTTETDPIDRSVSSITPVKLSAVHPTSQGLILFANNQQFLVTATDDIFTPETVNIKSISNFQCDPKVMPVDLGTTTAFISRSGGYTDLFEMLTRGQNEQPVIAELTKIVPELIPNDVNLATASPQAGFIILGRCASVGHPSMYGGRDVYVFRYWDEGQERNQAWTRWTFPEGLMLLHFDEDTLWVIGAKGDSISLSKLTIRGLYGDPSAAGYYVPYSNLSPFFENTSKLVEPKLDYFTKSAYYEYNPTTNEARIYLPAGYSPTDTAGLSNALTSTSAPFFLSPVPITKQVGGTFNGQYYVTVQGSSFGTSSGNNTNFVYGYIQPCSIELPRTYFRQGQQSEMSDYTAPLTIHRHKFVFGLTGPMNFYLRTRGRSAWTKVQEVPLENYYLESDPPIVDSAIFTLPIHQKNTNFSIRIDSPNPYPFTLSSSSWEGNYAPRFYRRV